MGRGARRGQGAGSRVSAPARRSLSPLAAADLLIDRVTDAEESVAARRLTALVPEMAEPEIVARLDAWNRGHASADPEHRRQVTVDADGLPTDPLLRAMYVLTQRDLHDLGIERLELSRGLGLPTSPAVDAQENLGWVDDLGRQMATLSVGEQQELSLPSSVRLSSWSASTEHARRMGDHRALGGGVFLLDAVVPASAVLSTARTGYGEGAEAEVVLLHQPQHVTLRRER